MATDALLMLCYEEIIADKIAALVDQNFKNGVATTRDDILSLVIRDHPVNEWFREKEKEIKELKKKLEISECRAAVMHDDRRRHAEIIADLAQLRAERNQKK